MLEWNYGVFFNLFYCLYLMSESYILNIKNVEYFTTSLKSLVANVVSIVYEPVIKTVEIIGTFTEQDKLDISSFIETYTNPDKTTIKSRKIISSTKLLCEETLDWFTMFDWSADVIIQNIILSVKLEPSSSDNLYNEVFRYGVRIVDISNNNILEEVEYYNEDYEDKIIPISNLNLSMGNVELEIQVKKYNKGNAIYIKKALVEHL